MISQGFHSEKLMGNIIPFDGIVISGDAMVNQASMTGESIPVRKEEGGSVFAGTVVEESEIITRVTAVSGSGRFDKIVRMIEESEKLKSGLESKAESLADGLAPFHPEKLAKGIKRICEK